MIQIELTQVGGQTYDITSRLDEESGVKIGATEKPSAVDRFLDDVRLVMHDEDGILRGLFFGVAPATKWRITITEDARTIFRGEIQRDTIDYDAYQEMVEWDTFSLEKVLMEIAGKTKVVPRRSPFESDTTYITLAQLFGREMTGALRDENPFEGLFDGFDLGVYANDQIRFSKTHLYRTTGPTSFAPDYLQEGGSPNLANWGVTTETAGGCIVTAYARLADGTVLPMTGRVISVDDTLDRIYVDLWTAFPFTGQVIPSAGFQATIGLPPSIGLDGRYTRLDPATTVKDLLESVMAEKNATIYIDFDTRKLTMRQRGDILSDRATAESLSVDPVLLDEPKPVITVLDEEVYDYVRLSVGAPIPPTPHFTGFVTDIQPGIFGWGVFRYAMTLVFDSGYETNPSDGMEVVIEGTNARHGKSISMALDASGYPGVRARRIYRSDFQDSEGRLRLLAEVQGDAPVSYTDSRAYIYNPEDPFLIANESYPPEESPSVGMWIRFDAATSSWAVPIIDVLDGNGVPEGRIFEETYKALTFRESASREDARDQEYQRMKFFNAESFSTAYLDRWKRYFLPVRRIAAGLQGRGYRVGDSILAGQKLFPGPGAEDRLVFRTADIHLVEDETMAVLVSR